MTKPSTSEIYVSGGVTSQMVKFQNKERYLKDFFHPVYSDTTILLIILL